MSYIDRLLSFGAKEWGMFILILFLLLFLGPELAKALGSWKNILGWESKTAKRLREDEELISQLKEKVDAYENNRVHDRAQSFNKQSELQGAISEIKDQLTGIVEQMRVNKEQSNRRVRSELKDRISQAYRYYSAKGEWNAMEKESLEDLIASYEDAGGENSFVHSKVQPEMYTWKVKEE